MRGRGTWKASGKEEEGKRGREGGRSVGDGEWGRGRIIGLKNGLLLESSRHRQGLADGKALKRNETAGASEGRMKMRREGKT